MGFIKTPVSRASITTGSIETPAFHAPGSSRRRCLAETPSQRQDAAVFGGVSGARRRLTQTGVSRRQQSARHRRLGLLPNAGVSRVKLVETPVCH
jgi:hypothetical protein